jgi:hypothetical protein
VGAAAAAVLWLPFLSFEARQGWQDLLIVFSGGQGGPNPLPGVPDRLGGLITAVSIWGTGRWIEVSRVSLVVLACAAIGAVIGLRARERIARIALITLVAGTLLVAGLGMGHRADIVMMWNTPLLLLAALGLASLPFRALGPAAASLIVAGNLFIFARAHDVHVARGLSLAQNRVRAAQGDAWTRSADDRSRTPPEASRYLPEDPPVVAGIGSEVWYLREVAQPGAGRAAAAQDAALGLR